ncbi:unnamed protein product, partial [marine sediment metagenome]
MRHSDIELTMKVYTDPRLLDQRKALEALPRLDLDPRDEPQKQRATGTDDRQPRSVKPRSNPAKNSVENSAANSAERESSRGLRLSPDG